GIPPPVTHETVCPDAVQVQPLPDADTKLKPEGRASMTVVAALVVPLPTLVTVSKYTPFPPTVNGPPVVLTRDRSVAVTFPTVGVAVGVGVRVGVCVALGTPGDVRAVDVGEGMTVTGNACRTVVGLRAVLFSGLLSPA